MHRLRLAGFVALGALGLVLVGSTVGWALDGRASGEVGRNVELAGFSIGGMRPADVETVVSKIAAGYGDTVIRVQAAGGGFTATAAELGVTIDVDGTVAAALDTGKTGSLPGRVFGWAWSLLSTRSAPLRVAVDEVRAYDVIREKDPGSKETAVEPGFAYEDGAFIVTPGKAGEGIDPDDLADAITDAAASGDESLIVEVRRGTVEPRFEVAAAERLADEAAALTAKGLKVEAGDDSATVPTATLRSWLRAEPEARGLVLAVDHAKAAADLGDLLPDAGDEAESAGFTVNSSGVVRTPAKNGTACCDETVGTRVLAALVDRSLEPLTVPLKQIEPRRTDAEAEALGITEQVSTFTTKHACCEARVENIHRISDIVRGAIIEPGATFSVNEFVGERTRAKGFVVAGVIEDGKFTEDVGGGISQFATTLFNAAFFAGLEFGEYQSHSIRISRYPTGREATMGYPHPDLQIKNTTPYGVLIWPTYTSTGVTVTLYSTEYYESVTQSGQTSSKSGSCTVYRTERTRVRDGESKTDFVRATYRAAEGVNCRDPYPPPSSTPPSTTPGSPTTTPTSPPTTGAPPTTTPPEDDGG